MDKFEYSPLNPERKEIRLLTFEDETVAGTADETAPLRCAVSIVSPFDVPKVSYNAISYCWGERPPLKTIILNGKEAMVPLSAIGALRTVCHPIHGRRNLPVWIDAICINQADNEEKRHQVAMMGEVYENASEVLICLGDEDSTTESSYGAIQTVLGSCSHGSATADTYLVPTSVWINVFRYFDSPWFRRLWPVQEVVRSASATCWRDKFSVNWEDVAVLAQVVGELRLVELLGDQTQGLEGLVRADGITSIKRNYRQQLETCLMISSMFETSDPRDRIYASLGLVDLTGRPSHSAELVRPDYNLSVKDVYTRAATATVLSNRRLRILSWAQLTDPWLRFSNPQAREGDTYDVPSWVPRYDMGASKWISLVSESRVRGSDADLDAPFGTDQRMGTILYVQGVVLGEVALRDPSVPDFRQSDVDTPEGLQNLMDCFGTLFDLAGRAEGAAFVNIVKQIALTCRMATRKETSDDEVQLIADFAAFLMMSKDCEKAANDHNLERCLLELGADHGDAKRHAKNLCSGSDGRHLVTISSGYYGMAPLYTKPGDVVCIVFRCGVPLVLRRKDNGYQHEERTGEFWQLVGSAYVYGVMEVSSRNALIQVQD